jgi:hypothetical protein
MRSVRRHVDRLGLDHSHFTGQRRWTDRQLESAVGSARTWSEVAETLGLSGGSSTTTIRGHALRLGLDTTHLVRPRPDRPVHEHAPSLDNVSRAGPLLAAAWFELSGQSVSWPLEPVRFDLLVWSGDAAQRVQVKTATVPSGSSWTVWLSTTGRRRRRTYDPDEIDQFFVIDGDLEYYLVPVAVVGGLMSIQLSAYQGYRLPRLGDRP